MDIVQYGIIPLGVGRSLVSSWRELRYLWDFVICIVIGLYDIRDRSTLWAYRQENAKFATLSSLQYTVTFEFPQISNVRRSHRLAPIPVTL